ncbi:type II toxin-antitoxin system RelE/ParE family toxin [Levilactobacillus koreensis]|uniref:Type II toxin-antitoxin system RelE/ParE family toxin n=1 Tax=Levilactobacillus koreensis TaxID=637971 RepID=A0AAC8UWK2_9LACO|nr:type II toxin-antitoxin system RelE/ParE family toxin [Levilactobacillus koreensis]AKP64774.1 hypothetical protein ABN16_07025 [Levilactobacillus koreensis]
MKFDYYDWQEFSTFLESLPPKDVARLMETIFRTEKYGLLIAERQRWVRKINKELYEIRSQQGNDIQRVIYFHVNDENYLITHGFTKKSPKTPRSEINKAHLRQLKFSQRKDNFNDK